MASVQDKLDKIQAADIDSGGRFKYILIKVYVVTFEPPVSAAKEKFKYVVRGYGDCPFHGDIYDRFVESLNKLEEGAYDTECVGGGRIAHEPKKITIFGYSQGYGQADHSISADILKKHFPSDYTITWNNDGY